MNKMSHLTKLRVSDEPVFSIRPFTLTRLLAVGDKASVFEATMADDGTLVAVKKIQLSLDAVLREKTVARMILAFKRFTVLDHVNLIKVSTMFEKHPESIIQPPEFIVIMEICRGGSLKRAIKETKSLSYRQIQKWALEILTGLAYLHSQNIVHANIKPSNILFAGPEAFSGNLKLGGMCDVAPLSQQVTQMQELSHTKGTFTYMSPEMIQGYSTGQNIGRKTDIWSFGCVVLEMVTRKAADLFVVDDKGTTQTITGNYPIMYCVSKGGRPAVPQDVPQILKEFIKRTLITLPEERATAEELLKSDFINCDTTNWPPVCRVTVDKV